MNQEISELATIAINAANLQVDVFNDRLTHYKDGSLEKDAAVAQMQDAKNEIIGWRSWFTTRACESLKKLFTELNPVYENDAVILAVRREMEIAEDRMDSIVNMVVGNRIDDAIRTLEKIRTVVAIAAAITFPGGIVVDPKIEIDADPALTFGLTAATITLIVIGVVWFTR